MMRVLLAVLIVFINCCLVISLLQNEGGKCILVAKPKELKIETDSISSSGIEICEILGNQVYNIIVGFISHSKALKRNWTEPVYNNSCQVIGIIGELDSKTVSIVSTLTRQLHLNLTLVASSLPSTSLPLVNDNSPNVLNMNPFEHYIHALVSFTNYLNWTRIGLISDDTNFNLFAAEKLQAALLGYSEIERSIIPYIVISDDSINVPEVLNQFKECGTQIIVLLVAKELESLLLSAAQRLDFRWPNYALIKFEFEPKAHNIQDALIIRNSLYRNKIEMIQDSITAVTLAQDQDISNMSFPGISGLVQFKRRKRLLSLHITLGNDINFATYDSNSQVLNVNKSLLNSGSIPHGSTIYEGIVSRSALHITLVLLIYIFCNIVITVNLILYLYFRNEPEIKATSVSVSICMFIACYLLLLFMPVHVYEVQPIEQTLFVGRVICNGLSWVSVIGLPFSLIFSTLFVKMLRVYAIFFQPYSYKKRLFSNKALLIYILVLLSPNILHLLLWAGVNPFTIMLIEIPTKRGAQIHYACSSRYTLVWVTVPMIYYIALILSMLALAVKTSKIRFKHFKDTKATNAFAFLSVLVFSLTILYWYFLFSMLFFLEAGIPLYVGHTTGTLLCQFILFTPKVLPPTKRWFLRNKVNSKLYS